MLIGFGAAVLGFVLMLVCAGGWAVIARLRRWRRIVRDNGDCYDSDGLRLSRHPGSGRRYYARGRSVLLPFPEGGTGWIAGDPKWCIAYDAVTGRLYFDRRSRQVKKAPELLDPDHLEEYRPKMEALADHAFPWARDERPPANYDCPLCGVGLVTSKGLDRHLELMHPDFTANGDGVELGLALIANGLSVRAAAEVVGVPRSTLHGHARRIGQRPTD